MWNSPITRSIFAESRISRVTLNASRAVSECPCAGGHRLRFRDQWCARRVGRLRLAWILLYTPRSDSQRVKGCDGGGRRTPRRETGMSVYDNTKISMHDRGGRNGFIRSPFCRSILYRSRELDGSLDAPRYLSKTVLEMERKTEGWGECVKEQYYSIFRSQEVSPTRWRLQKGEGMAFRARHYVGPVICFIL